MIGFKHKRELTVHHNLDSSEQVTDHIIRNYKVGERINEVIVDRLEYVYRFNGKTILAIDSSGVYKGLSFKPDYILLHNSPRINLNRLIDSINPKAIIADASNFKIYVKRWKSTCRDKKIPFHYTNEKGAFMLN